METGLQGVCWSPRGQFTLSTAKRASLAFKDYLILIKVCSFASDRRAFEDSAELEMPKDPNLFRQFTDCFNF